MNDVVVPIEYSDAAVAALRAAGATALNYTRVRNAPAPVGWPSYEGHASWIPAFGSAELWDWFLLWRRKTPEEASWDDHVYRDSLVL